MSEPSPPLVEVDPNEAQRLFEEGAFLLDVREDEEWVAGHGPDAHHIPMGAVSDRIAEVPTDRTVVCICRVGGRSGAVAGALADAGYDVRNLAGGMQAWEAAGFPVVDDAGNGGQVV
jgi:rhodanese-related sulfurtransferase